MENLDIMHKNRFRTSLVCVCVCVYVDELLSRTSLHRSSARDDKQGFRMSRGGTQLCMRLTGHKAYCCCIPYSDRGNFWQQRLNRGGGDAK